MRCSLALGCFSAAVARIQVKTCPDIGARFDNYSEKALAAVLGLIAGAGAITLSQQASSSDCSITYVVRCLAVLVNNRLA